MEKINAHVEAVWQKKGEKEIQREIKNEEIENYSKEVKRLVKKWKSVLSLIEKQGKSILKDVASKDDTIAIYLFQKIRFGEK